MAANNRSEAYDLSLYDMPVIRQSAAPQIERKPVQKRAEPQTVAQARKNSVSSAFRVLKLFAVYKKKALEQ